MNPDNIQLPDCEPDPLRDGYKLQTAGHINPQFSYAVAEKEIPSCLAPEEAGEAAKQEEEAAEELDDLLVSYPGGCGETIMLTWNYTAGDIVQTGLSPEEGSFFNYITAVPTEGQAAAGLMSVKINNDFGGVRYFRIVTAAGIEKTKAVLPLAAQLESPAVSITNVELSGSGLNEEGPFTVPYSKIENPFISQDDIYVEPRARYEWEGTLNFDGRRQILSVSNVPAGGSFKFTRNLADPTADTVIPILEAEANNVAAYRTDFKMVVKVRCFSGECKSPLTVILVDKRYLFTDQVKTTVLAQTSIGACTFPKDFAGGQVTAQEDCQETYGGTTAFDNILRTIACGSLQPGVSAERYVMHQAFSSTFQTGSSANFFFDSHNAAVTRIRGVSVVPPGRSGQTWDAIPAVHEYLDIASSSPATAYAKVGGNVAGSGGTFDAAVAISASFIGSILKPCIQDWLVTLTKWEYILSAHEDDAVFTPPASVPDGFYGDEPEPPLEPSPGDDFEAYVDGDASTQTLDQGVGWDDDWTIRTRTLLEGYELWDDYTDEVISEDPDDPTILSGGEGWTDSWTIVTAPIGLIYGDDFESYSDGVPTLLMLGGTGWADNDETDTVDYWHFGVGQLVCTEDWESYSDGVVTTASGLNGGVGWLSEAWTINE